MQHGGTILLIILGIALLLAVGVLVFGVGRFGYGIAHYNLRERKPERLIRHAEFGVFTSDGKLWSCEVHQHGRELRLVIGGTDDAPSERLLVQARSILERLVDIEQRALSFLRSREEDVRVANLDFYCLDITDEQRPDNYALDRRDDSRVWRVEFAAGEPRHTGFDD